MTRDDSGAQVCCEALDDYRRAKQVWEVLARKQRADGHPTLFALEEKFLQELGCRGEDLPARVRDLQGVLAKLHEFTWHWDRCGPLSPRPDEPGLVAHVTDGTLVIGPQFWEVRKLFTTHSILPPET